MTQKSFIAFLLEMQSAINITDPVIQQKIRSALDNGDPTTVLALYRKYAGKAKPAKWKKGPILPKPLKKK